MAEPEATEPHAPVAGRYRLLRKLGAGGMGQVWLAHDDGPLDRDVAVKELKLPESLSPDERTERIERAVREARNAARVSHHPNVVTVHDIVVHDDAPWIVMEYVPSRDLGRILAEEGPLPALEANRIAGAVLDALTASHQAGIVHRDVKPANVLLTADGHVFLTDFGIAVAETDTTLTATGVLIATPEYVAPERARGLAAGPASDLFSLGATLYEAVEGRSPFRRDTGIATLTALLMDEPEYPARAGALAPLLYDLLRKEPTHRPDSAEARRRLAEAARQAADSATQGSAASGPEPPVSATPGSAPGGWPTTSPRSGPRASAPSTPSAPPTVSAAPATWDASRMPPTASPAPQGWQAQTSPAQVPGRTSKALPGTARRGPRWSPLGLAVQAVLTVAAVEIPAPMLLELVLVTTVVAAIMVWSSVGARRRRL